MRERVQGSFARQWQSIAYWGATYSTNKHAHVRKGFRVAFPRSYALTEWSADMKAAAFCAQLENWRQPNWIVRAWLNPLGEYHVGALVRVGWRVVVCFFFLVVVVGLLRARAPFVCDVIRPVARSLTSDCVRVRVQACVYAIHSLKVCPLPGYDVTKAPRELVGKCKLDAKKNAAPLQKFRDEYAGAQNRVKWYCWPRRDNVSLEPLRLLFELFVAKQKEAREGRDAKLANGKFVPPPKLRVHLPDDKRVFQFADGSRIFVPHITIQYDAYAQAVSVYLHGGAAARYYYGKGASDRIASLCLASLRARTRTKLIGSLAVGFFCLFVCRVSSGRFWSFFLIVWLVYAGAQTSCCVGTRLPPART